MQLPRPQRTEPEPDPTQREQLATFLTIMLTLVFGGAFAAFLVFVSLGLFLWVILISGVIAIFVGIHYLAWGRATQTNDGRETQDGPGQGVP